ncbi:tautomerase family protein [Nonomuraea fastidiosa]|jgi:phenylpyruvate tautomerase PptA (4-oxalocrotonate tautomerase family)|uniref:tautomerase family protein n=1 Tax=Nonomuraea TaxID=83681 RepID=UPI003440D6E9
MPFVRIDAMRAAPERLDALGRAVHDAMVETIGIPSDDLFQVLTSHDGARSVMRYGTFPGLRRTDDVVFIAITFRAGRTPEQKKAMYRRIAERAREYAGTEPRDVFISVTENGPIDWSFGDGVAHYVP